MKKVLVVVDMQNDFIDGSLGTPEAQAIVPKVVEKIKNWDGRIVFTKDTHNGDYLNTREGKHLPIEHCINGSYGQELNSFISYTIHKKYPDIVKAIKEDSFLFYEKSNFSDNYMPTIIEGMLDLEDVDTNVEFHICGLCTDICVISNAITIQSFFKDSEICIDASCCAGTTPEMHRKALDVMRGLQMNIINDNIVS